MPSLNLPIVEQLSSSEHILIAGMGGGYDVFCGLPVYFQLLEAGRDVHLANFSFADVANVDGGEELTSTLIGITGDLDIQEEYFPEFFLSQWFEDTANDEVVIWCFHKTGARPLIQNYRTLIEHLEIDAIILVDGGVDSLMRGDEPQPGTLLEDSLSLLAVNEMKQVPVRILATLGLGAEQDLGYAHAFENIAALMAKGACLGSCSLTRNMKVYREYEQAALAVFDRQPAYPSVISSSIISAVRGNYGNYHLTRRTRGSHLHISPLMTSYWFFDLPAVAAQNLILPALRLTYTIDQAWQAMHKARQALPERAIADYPLP